MFQAVEINIFSIEPIQAQFFVIEKGQIIDDTAIKISDELRDLLRQRAFLKIEEDRMAAAQKVQEAEEFKAALAIGSDEKTAVEQQINAIEEVIDEADEVSTEADGTTESKNYDDE